MSLKKKAFTLVEMLIVVVIIGILAAALIPRLTGAQSKARDAARKWNLNQISTALTQYFNDKGVYIDWYCTSASAFSWLIWTYINSIPLDPQSGRIAYGTTWAWCINWAYWYLAINRNWATKWWMVLVANTETEWTSSNYVIKQWWTDVAAPTLPTATTPTFTWWSEATDKENMICSKWVSLKINYLQCDAKNGVLEWWAKALNGIMEYVIFQ